MIYISQAPVSPPAHYKKVVAGAFEEGPSHVALNYLHAENTDRMRPHRGFKLRNAWVPDPDWRLETRAGQLSLDKHSSKIEASGKLSAHVQKCCMKSGVSKIGLQLNEVS